MNKITQLSKSKIQNLVSLIGKVTILVAIAATCIVSVVAIINKIVSE